ncbi:MAG TPA: peptide deformylase [Bacteroidales bacterium]|nr:peptide deformylase [Bacteroidales bacterium]
MILPIVAHGHPVLKQVGEDFPQGDPAVARLIEDMFETMYASSGVGLAGQQVGVTGRIFVIDATPFAEDGADAEGFRKAFVNPHIVAYEGGKVPFEEGCLSFPGLREVVERPESVRIQYYDEQWNFHEEEYSGILARIIQHEYDHVEGVVFIDRISTLRRTLLGRKLKEISEGHVDADYRMVFARQKKSRKRG